MGVSEKRNIRSRMGGLAVYNEQQEAIHNGHAFSYDSEGTIAAGESLYLLGVTGEDQIHFDALAGSFEAGGIRLTLYSDPTVTDNGTGQTLANGTTDFGLTFEWHESDV